MMQTRLFSVHDWGYKNHLERWDVHVLMNMYNSSAYG